MAAWEYFPHDHARSRAYRWGEDGIAGISDDKATALLCPGFMEWQGSYFERTFFWSDKP